MPQVKSGNSNPKIVVLSASSIEARGYSANIHPEGYVYFTKNKETAPEGSIEPSTVQDLNVSQQVDSQNSNEVHSSNEYCQQGEADGYNMSSENLNEQGMSEAHSVEHGHFVNIKNEHVYDINNEGNSINYGEHSGSVNSEITEPLERSYDNSNVPVMGNLQVPDSSFQNQINHLGNNILPLLGQSSAKESIKIQTERDDQNKFTRQKITYTFATGNAKIRKLHKSYISSWTKHIEKQGFARCLIASCNFLSLNLFDMQEHYKTCDGSPSYSNNLCNICNSRLPDPQQLNIHMSACEGLGRQVTTVRGAGSNAMETEIMNNFRVQEWEKQINEYGIAPCGISQCNYQSSNITDLQMHQISCDGMAHYDSNSCMLCRRLFSRKEDVKKHQPFCPANPANRKKSDPSKSKKPELLHFKDIIKINRGPSMNMDCIVQPSPPIPNGIYVRRRGYTKQHKESWEAAIKKKRYVKCMFKNCYFLGMSVEDMISHFGYCSGDGSFAQHICQYCQGRVTSSEVLQIHIVRSHPVEYQAEIAKKQALKEKHRVYKISEIKNCEPKKERVDVTEENTQNSSDYVYDSLYGEPMCSITVNQPVSEPERVDRVRNKDNLVKSPERPVPRVVRTYQRKSKVNKMIEAALMDLQNEVGMPEKHAGRETENTLNYDQCNEERAAVTLNAVGENNRDRGFEQEEGTMEQVTFTPSTYEISQGPVQDHRSSNETEIPIREMNSLLLANNEDRRELDPLCTENEPSGVEMNKIFLKTEIHQHEEIRNSEMRHEENLNYELQHETNQNYELQSEDNRNYELQHETNQNYQLQPEDNRNFELRHEEDQNSEMLQENGNVHEPVREEQAILPDATSEHQFIHEDTFQEISNAQALQCVDDHEPIREEQAILPDVTSPHEEFTNENQLNLFPIVPEEPQPQPEPEPQLELPPVKRETRRSTRNKTSNDDSQKSLIQIRDSFSLLNHDETIISDQTESQPPPKKKRGRKRKVVEETVTEQIPLEPEVIIKRRGRKRVRSASVESEDLPLSALKVEEYNVPEPEVIENNNVKCAKCEMEMPSEEFEDHNYRKHVGTGWIEGHEPFDMENVQLLETTVKKVFRVLKSVKCEICGSVKKSALGYVSHIQSCGKSKEEKDALKVECLECGAKVLRYSLPIHMKSSHPDPLPEFQNYQGYTTPQEELPEHLAGKRRSAVRAATKFQSVLEETEEDAAAATKSLSYVFFKKNSSAIPKLPRKIQMLWSKMKKEGRGLPCRRAQCFFESNTLQEARQHHFMCPELPDEVYVCECCDYYTESESEIKNHAQSHLEPVEQDFAYSIDEFEAENQQEMDIDESIVDEVDDVLRTPQKKTPIKTSKSFEEMSIEAENRRAFMIREKLINPKNNQLYHQTLDMSLEAETLDLEDLPLWPEFTTKESDWVSVESSKISEYLPPLSESVSVHITREKVKNVDWKVFKRFESDNIADSPVMFTGGSVTSMSWCRIFAHRLKEKCEKQYLAVASCHKMDMSRNIRELSSSPGLIQIWDCGVLENSRAMDLPEMVLGIAHNGGEISDLSWVPADLYSEGSKEYLPRLGILGAACQDGNVRVWSICDPSGLSKKNEFRIYDIHPSMILRPSDVSDVCLKLAISKKGLVAGGYSSGVVYLWNFECINSPFTKKEGKTYIVRPYSSFMAHRSPITALAMSQVDGHYIGTSGYDRTVKFWDVQFPSYPTEVFSKETGLDIVFPRHWPITFFCFEDVIAGASKAIYKAIKDIVFEGHRTALCLESVLWNLSFSDWLNTLCGSSLIGEVKIRFFRNIFMADQKHGHRAEAVLSGTELRRLNSSAEAENKSNDKTKSKKEDPLPETPRTYEEAKSSFGLVITDYSVDLSAKKDKVVKHKFIFDEYPIKSTTKVCFNPNFESFTHLAIGYHCGLIRIVTLEKIQRDLNLIKFINRHKAS